MSIDHRALVGAEMHDIADLVASLDEDQLHAPSLCDGWRVRDVAAHMASGSSVTLPQVFGAAARQRFNVAKASYLMAIAYADSHTAGDMAATLHRFADDYASGRKKDGLARMIKPKDLQVDNLIHEQDIRRPLGLPSAVPEERLRAALDTAPTLAGFVKCKQRAAGLHLRSTDVDWSAGAGPSVAGPALDLLLALSGRPAGLDGLTGDGVSVLAERVKAA